MTTMTTGPGTQLPAKQNPNGGAIVQRKFDPLAPIGDAGSLKGLMESQKNGLAEMLPRHITPERLFKTMLVAANRNPDIYGCTQMSLIETINRAAELGLDLSGTLGEAYPVPFNNTIKVRTDRGMEERKVKQLQLIIGYRGYEKLAWQSGLVEHIDAEVVYINDKFIFKKGTSIIVEFEPLMNGNRGVEVGAYAVVKMKGGGVLARFLGVDDIEKIRKSSKSSESPAWKYWWSEMARKCALKRTLKDAPLSTEKMTKAMEYDSEDFSEIVEAVINHKGLGHSKTDALNRQLADASAVTKRPVSEGQTLEPTDEALAEARATIDAATAKAREIAEARAATQPNADPEPGKDAGDTAGGDGAGGEADADPNDGAGNDLVSVREPSSLITPLELYSALENAAQALGVAPSDMNAWVARELPPDTSKQNKMNPDARRAKLREFVTAHRGVSIPPER